MNEKTKIISLGVFTGPISNSGLIPLSNLLDILQFFSNDIYLITGNTGYTFFKDKNMIHTYGFRHEKGKNAFTRILKFLYAQLKISIDLARTVKNVNIWFFFIGGDTAIFPMLVTKLFRKKVILVFAGSSIQSLKFSNDNLFKLLKILSNVNCTFSKKIIVYSENLIKDMGLEKYGDRISIAPKHFLDFEKLKAKIKFDKRTNLVGYIGRLSKEKGSLNFVEAIPKIAREKNMVKFLIGGDGSLKEKIEVYLEENYLKDKVRLVGWIPHDGISEYLNKLRLIVLPSYTEGLPNIMLEAMACGTPVLATSVGSIPDVITDGETGFIMGDNSPECIAENVVRALNHPNLDEIANKAREFVKKEFTYEAAVERYKKIIDDIKRPSNGYKYT